MYIHNYFFYLHFYVDQDGEARCSQWTNQTWEEYLSSYYRDYLDMGEDNPITLLKTERRIV